MMSRPAAARVHTALFVFLAVASMATAAAAQRPDRSAPPAPGPPPQLDLPPIQKESLSNGLRVWLIESHKVPLVQVNLLVHAGSGDDPAGKFGVASLTAAMLDEGAGARSALEIADDIELLGGALSTVSSFDASGVRLNVPAARLADALPILADVALRPTFPEHELDRLREERLTALLQARNDPATVAALAFARQVFGAAHRYGTGATGTPATLRSFTTQDLRAFHAAMYLPSNAALVVAGAVTMESLLPRLEEHFGGWRTISPVTRVPVPTAPRSAAREVTIVDMPGAAQSQIRIGWVGVPRATPDYFPLQVLNAILGGSFTSRLNQNLREQHGYSYGASSRFEMRLSAGPFVAGAGVQTDKTAEALREFFHELHGIQAPVEADELAKARNFLALGFPGEFETIRDLAAHIEELIVYNLPDDYFEQYIGAIQAVTADSIRRAAATYIQPDRFVVTIVGDRQEIEPGIRALDLGPVRILTVDEALGN
jgi:zinc protease